MIIAVLIIEGSSSAGGRMFFLFSSSFFLSSSNSSAVGSGAGCWAGSSAGAGSYDGYYGSVGNPAKSGCINKFIVSIINSISSFRYKSVSSASTSTCFPAMKYSANSGDKLPILAPIEAYTSGAI